MEGGGRGPRWSILAVVALLVLPGRLAVQHPLVGMRCMEPGTRQMEVADSIGRSSASHFVGGSRLLLAGVRIQAGFSSCLILSMRGGAGVEGPAKEEEAAGMDDDEVMRDGDGDQEEQEEEAGAAERELAAFDDDDDGRPGHGGEDDDSDSNKRKDPTEWRDGFESGEDEFEEQLLNYESETDPDLEYMRQVGEDTPRERALEMVGELRRRGQEAGTPGKMAIDAGDSGQQGPIPVATQPGTPAPSASSRVVKPVGADAGDNGLEGQLLVPDDVENVPTAVKAAAWVEEGEDPVGIFVRKGIHRWDAEIALYPRYDLDMPPGVEFIEGMVQNTSKHYVYQTQMETLNSTRKRGRLELSGDPGALMWGRWLLEVGSEGHFKNVQLLSDPVLAGESQVPDITAATFEAVSSNVSFSQCGLRCVKGVCLRVAEESNVRVIECAMGGLGQDERSKCASCVTVWDQSQVAVGRSIMSDGMMGSAGVRVCGEAEVAVRGSRFERLFTAVCLHHRGSLSIIDSVFHNQTHSALFAGGEHDNGTRLTLQGCTIDSTVWADDGRPGKVIESKNVLMGGQSSDEMEFKRLKEETEEMERRTDELERMPLPSEMFMQTLGRDGQEFDDDALTQALAGDKLGMIKEKIREVTRLLKGAHKDYSKAQLTEMLGPDTEEWLQDSEEEGGGMRPEDGESWDTSDDREEEEVRGEMDAEDRELAKNERLLGWVLRGLERIPTKARGEQDQQLLREVPAMMVKIDDIRRKLKEEPQY